MKNVIQHQDQVDPLGCVSACLAMVLNMRVEDVTEEFHSGYIDNEEQPHEYLESAGIPFRSCYAHERYMKPDHIYMVSVPSANLPGGTHMIVIHMTSDDCWILYDPNLGRDGRISYGSFGDEDAPEGFAQIKSWTPVYEFGIFDVAKRYNIENPFNGDYIGCENLDDESYIFTFGSNHFDKDGNCLANNYLSLYGTYESTREEIVDARGDKWSFQYGEPDLAGITQFNLKPVTIEQVTLEGDHYEQERT